MEDIEECDLRCRLPEAIAATAPGTRLDDSRSHQSLERLGQVGGRDPVVLGQTGGGKGRTFGKQGQHHGTVRPPFNSFIDTHIRILVVQE